MKRYSENASDRYSYVGEVYSIGEEYRKKEILSSLPKEWSDLHKKGFIHIHDLDAYGLTYNCLTLDILRDFPYERFTGLSQTRKIICVFEYLKNLFTDIGNEQSGGMALANFDNDIATILKNLEVELTDTNKELIGDCISQLINWCNHTHTRSGRTSYYVTFNIGLAKNEFARFLARTLVAEYDKGGALVYKPNIVFKVKAGVNRYEGDPNFDLYNEALLCTARKMIPTYVLCDSEPNKDVNPEKLAIMGCRTRVVANLFGEESSIGRGNVVNASINLPRIAILIEREMKNLSEDGKMKAFQEKWDQIAEITKNILLDRFNKTCKRKTQDFPINSTHHLWKEDFECVSSVLRHGTISLGFIGLSEAMEILFKKRFYEDPQVYSYSIAFVNHMREYCNFLRNHYKLNFSLLATSGELISGRFTELDKAEFGEEYPIFEKGFYTNSFHINVDSGLSGFKKIKLEGAFHQLCNGGCITYVELGESPLSNSEGLREYVECAIESGVHYLGFNFPKDVCNSCGVSGVFDKCPECNSESITRIRRVSGYLEILDGFTRGKKNEEKARRAN